MAYLIVRDHFAVKGMPKDVVVLMGNSGVISIGARVASRQEGDAKIEQARRALIAALQASAESKS